MISLNSALEKILKFFFIIISKSKKAMIPPMNHPWRRQQFGKFVKQQEHHQNDQDTKIA